MALKETVHHLKEILHSLTHDLVKAEGGNKAASQRVRTGTVKLEKVAKLYRKESIKSEKTTTKSPKKSAKKAVAHKKAAPAKKAAPKAKAAAKAKPKAVHAKARAMSFRRPSAKLPVRRASR